MAVIRAITTAGMVLLRRRHFPPPFCSKIAVPRLEADYLLPLPSGS